MRRCAKRIGPGSGGTWRLGIVAAACLALAGSGPSPPGTANRLGEEMSPYLVLHAHNPVDWYPWGEEALARARREDKPIFLSVGYSTCYWCHVMEREVFSDPEIAELMNRWFVNVKVDREERPELDEIYMAATQLLTGRGGWPNSVFLTPDLRPVFAGTYFPPRDRAGLPGFPSVLESLADAWKNRRSEVELQAKRVTEALREALTGAPESAPPPPIEAAERVVEAIKRDYDETWGGFGGPQKFPSPGELRLLWQVARQGDGEARRMVVSTLAAMGRGAIYDQLDGGFHRYTLDRRWRVPHFEKMLYDNAQLGELLAVVAIEQADSELERLARGTLDFVLAEMALPVGAFKSAIDAETDTVEGAFYLWSRRQLEAALGGEAFALLGPIFGFEGEPNFEGGHYTLYLTAPLVEHAARLDLGRPELLARLEPHLERLRRVRSQRTFPLVDDKVLTDWNGMMVAALARAGAVLGEERYLRAAERAARFLLTLTGEGGTLLHVWRAGEARIPAYLDDYAFLIDGLLVLDEVTDEAAWRQEARRLAGEAMARLAAPGGAYHASGEQPGLLVRARPASDGAIPAANGVMVLNLLRLAEAGGGEALRRDAAAALGAFGRDFERWPRGMATLARALTRYHAGAPAVAGSPAPDLEALARSLVRPAARWRGEASGGWRPFEVELTIAPGWHVNANPATLDFLVATRIEGRVREMVYPPGEGFRFAFADHELEVYSGTIRIRGQAAAAEPLQLTYQACDDRRCLPPVTLAVLPGTGPP